MKKMQSIFKKVGLFAIALAMLVTITPTSVLAENQERLAAKPNITQLAKEAADGSHLIASVQVGGEISTFYSSGSFEAVWSFVKIKSSASVDIEMTLYDDWFPDESIVLNTKGLLTLDLNNHKIDRALSSAVQNGEVIKVDNGSKLVIEDNSAEKQGKITGGFSSNGAGGVQIVNGEVDLMSGSIDHNQASGDGGAGVKLNKNESVFVMKGGKISYNTASGTNGGGISIYNGSASLLGGMITCNDAKNGGGIYVSTNQGGDTLTVNKDTFIENNTADYGGGIALVKGASIISGTIRNNIAISKGGGIFVDDGTVGNNRINGATITYNYCNANGRNKGTTATSSYDANGYGGGIYVCPSDKLDINGATIEYNGAAYGGGIYSDTHAGLSLGSYSAVTVTNNLSTNWYLTEGTRITMDRTLVTGSLIYVYLENPDRYSMVSCTSDNTASKVHSTFVLADESMGGYYITDDANNYGGQLYAVKGSLPSLAIPSEYNGQKLVRGTFKYATAEGALADRSAIFYYSDGYFLDRSSAMDNTIFSDDLTGNAKNYNSHLATMSMCMAMSAFGANAGGTTDYTNKSQYVKQLFSDIGMQAIYVNEAFTKEPETDSMGVAIGHKTLSDGSTLMSIALRGANYQSEWASNVTVGESGEHKGFHDSAQIVLDEIAKYIQANNLTWQTTKFWIAGYSRAGAVTNLTAKRLTDLYNRDTDGSRVFAYCFEAPKGGVAGTTGYSNIKNLVNKNDIVPLVAPSQMGFIRYGEDHTLYEGNIGNSEYNTKKSKMLTQLSAVNNEIIFDDRFVNATINYVQGGLNMFIDGWGKVCATLAASTGASLVAAAASPIAAPVVASTILAAGITAVCVRTDLIVEKGFDKWSTLEEFNNKFIDCFYYYSLNYENSTYGNARNFYANGNPLLTAGMNDADIPTFQEALRKFIVLFQTIPSEYMSVYMKKALDTLKGLELVGGDGLTLKELYTIVVGGAEMVALNHGWDNATNDEKQYIFRQLRSLLTSTDSGAGTALSVKKENNEPLTAEEAALDTQLKGYCDTLNEILPSLLSPILYLVKKDYKDYDQYLLGTLVKNKSSIMQAHYPEVNLAWVRTDDSLYQNEQGRTVVPEVQDVEPEVPTASVASGTYEKELSVKLSTNPAGAVIYYTTDGTDPQISDTAQIYIGNPIVLKKSEEKSTDYVINAFAKYNTLASQMATFNYTITPTKFFVETNGQMMDGTKVSDLSAKQYFYNGDKAVITAVNQYNKPFIKFAYWILRDEYGNITKVLADGEENQQTVSFKIPNKSIHATAVYQYTISEMDLQVTKPSNETRAGSAEWMFKIGNKYYRSSGYADTKGLYYTGKKYSAIPLYWGGLNTDTQFTFTTNMDPNVDLIPMVADDVIHGVKPYYFDNEMAVTVNGNVAKRSFDKERMNASYTFTPIATAIETPELTLSTDSTVDDLKKLLPSTVKVTTDMGVMNCKVGEWDTTNYSNVVNAADHPYVMTSTIAKTIIDMTSVGNTAYANLFIKQGIVAKPVADVPSGKYDTALTVKLSAETGAEIYYTMDDTIADDQIAADVSRKYSAAISITQKQGTLNLRTVATKNNKVSEVAAYSYEMAIPQLVKIECNGLSDVAKFQGTIDTFQYSISDITDSTITITAPIVENRVFLNWTFPEGNDSFTGISTTDTSITIDKPADNLSLTANYVPIVKKIDATYKQYNGGETHNYFYDVDDLKFTYYDGTIEDRTERYFAIWYPIDKTVEWNKEYSVNIISGNHHIRDYLYYEYSPEIEITVNGKALPPSAAFMSRGNVSFAAIIGSYCKVPKITSIINPDDITNLDNGIDANKISLPNQVEITAEDGLSYYVDVTWDEIGTDLYDPTITTQQDFTVHGTFVLPDDVDDTDPAFSKDTYVNISVNAMEPVAAPIASIASGTYTDSLNVSLYSATRGAKIYYTLDGSEPTVQSTQYEEEIALPAGDNKLNTYEVKAIAVKERYLNSLPRTFDYKIGNVIDPDDGYVVVDTSTKLPWN
jgi:hypothetical protein